MSTKSNISTASPFFSVISCSVLIYIHLPPPRPSLHISQFQNWLNDIKGSTAVHNAVKISFSFFNSSSVESHRTVPESDEYEKI